MKKGICFIFSADIIDKLISFWILFHRLMTDRADRLRYKTRRCAASVFYITGPTDSSSEEKAPVR